MTSLAQVPPRVHPDRRVYDPSDFPWLGGEAEPFHPSPEDEATDLGFRLARDGEAFKPPSLRVDWPVSCLMGFLRGAAEGRRSRELAEAYELGRALGLETEISEPPGGFSAEEKAEYRRGFAAGRAEAEDDRATEAWVAERDQERMVGAFGCPITDLDVHRHGVC